MSHQHLKSEALAQKKKERKPLLNFRSKSKLDRSDYYHHHDDDPQALYYVQHANGRVTLNRDLTADETVAYAMFGELPNFTFNGHKWHRSRAIRRRTGSWLRRFFCSEYDESFYSREEKDGQYVGLLATRSTITFPLWSYVLLFPFLFPEIKSEMTLTDWALSPVRPEEEEDRCLEKDCEDQQQ